MTALRPGVELSRDFYHELVRPIMDADFPGLIYVEAFLDCRSEDRARVGEDVGDDHGFAQQGIAASVPAFHRGSRFQGSEATLHRF